MKQFEMYEMKFRSHKPVLSEVAVELQAEFVHGEEKTVVKGFYGGDGNYYLRFLPRKTGAASTLVYLDYVMRRFSAIPSIWRSFVYQGNAICNI
ncbi:hypothetical protein C808_03833 [Lachnospiraceae bacterium M18-1]|nr:hypothetical protein C808_03833 [Lachnospiraceae bacterium M18-1]